MNLFFGLFGVFWGSFLGVVTERSLQGSFEQKKFKQNKRSVCLECGQQLRLVDLIPVFSWLCLLGKCHFCKANIPVRILGYELSTAIFFLLIPLFPIGNSTYGIVSLMLLWSFCMPLFVLDMKNRYMPYKILLLFGIVGFLFALAPFLGIQSFGIITKYKLLGAVVGFVGSAIFRKLVGEDRFGFGDVILFFSIGIFVGLRALPAVIVLGTTGTILQFFWAKYIQKNGNNGDLPLGSWLCAGLLVVYALGINL